MTKKQQLHEIGIISAIIADTILKQLYVKMQDNGNGYISTVDQISLWAQEFLKVHKNTNWEEILEVGMKPLSKKIKSIICWDDAIIDFSHYKLDNF